MRKISVIVIAIAGAIVAVVGHSVTKSEHLPQTAADTALNPSPFQMMVDARDLQSTPFVAP